MCRKMEGPKITECFLAVSMNQRTVSSGRVGSVSFWAWMVSIAVHLIVLTAFGVVKFSQSQTGGKHRPTPIAKINQIKKLMQANPIIPKPKIKKSAKGRYAGRTNRLFPANRIFDTAKPSSPILANNNDGLAKPSASQSASSLAGSRILPHKIEFFGSFAEQRKVCYLVDCSGSMQGVFGRVRKKLKESIASLQPDQYFYIIFFGGDKLFEFGNGLLLRASQKTKSAAYDFIDLVQPAGQTNALAALERAVQIRDRRGLSPSIVYFLTDGFELTTEDAQRFPQKIANLQKRFAPMTRINTIGFWPQGNDRKMLEAIARQSGGEFVFVADGDT
jgi:hypothetical protein